MVDTTVGSWKVNRIVTENAPSPVDSPHAHRPFAAPQPRAPNARRMSSADRPSTRRFSAFTIQHSALAAPAQSRAREEAVCPPYQGGPQGVAPKPGNVPATSDPPSLPNPLKTQNGFCETNPKNRPGDPKNADSPKKTNPNEPTAQRERMHEESRIKNSELRILNSQRKGCPPFAIMNSPFAIPLHASRGRKGR